MTDEQARNAMERLLRWWESPDGQLPLPVAKGFEFNSGLQVMNAEEWCWFHSHSAGYSDVELLGIIAGGDGAASVVEATDRATGIRYRIAWVVRWKDDCLLNIMQTAGRVHSRDISEARSRD